MGYTIHFKQFLQKNKFAFQNYFPIFITREVLEVTYLKIIFNCLSVSVEYPQMTSFLQNFKAKDKVGLLLKLGLFSLWLRIDIGFGRFRVPLWPRVYISFWRFEVPF